MFIIGKKYIKKINAISNINLYLHTLIIIVERIGFNKKNFSYRNAICIKVAKRLNLDNPERLHTTSISSVFISATSYLCKRTLLAFINLVITIINIYYTKQQI